jgi:hypothetical protein
MTAKIISKDEEEIIIQVKVSLKGSMLDSEQSIVEGINQVGVLATKEALKRFDTDGSPIEVGDVKFTVRCQSDRVYQSPYGEAKVSRYVYQTSKGGKTFIPLELNARIIQGATPRFAKMLSHKYSNLSAPTVVDDLLSNHSRKTTISYLQNVSDYVGSIAQAKEESWEYETPTLKKPVDSIGISLDGAYVLTVEHGYREAMVGTIALYDSEGERLHTTYIAASPEYGKETFFARLSREIERMKATYPSAETIGIADGAKNNWGFLKQHTNKQILDFWHASEYLANASHAIYTKKSQGLEREEWLENQCHNLKHKKGAATRILNELTPGLEKRLTKPVKENLTATVTYFKNNIKAGRMKYYDHINNNLPIGSGVVEAACKTIIKQRLGASGMRWKDAGMKVILSLRTLTHTKGRWDQFWEKIDNFGTSSAY